MNDQYDKKEKKKKITFEKDDEIIIDIEEEKFVPDLDVLKVPLPVPVIRTRDMTEDEWIFNRLPLSKSAKEALINEHLKSLEEYGNKEVKEDQKLLDNDTEGKDVKGV